MSEDSVLQTCGFLFQLPLQSSRRTLLFNLQSDTLFGVQLMVVQDPPQGHPRYVQWRQEHSREGQGNCLATNPTAPSHLCVRATRLSPAVCGDADEAARVPL